MDQRTWIGHMCKLIYCCVTPTIFFLTAGSILLLFVAIGVHHRAFYEMFRHSVRKLSIPDESRNDEEFVCKLIRFHIDVKE